MFDRFVRTSQARNALNKGEFAHCLRLLDDPDLREHRRTDRLRERAIESWCARGIERAHAGSVDAAESDLAAILAQIRDAERDLVSVTELRKEIEEAKTRRTGLLESLEAWEQAVRRALDEGGLDAARRMFGGAEPSEQLRRSDTKAWEAQRNELESLLEDRRKRADAAIAELDAALKDGDAELAANAYLQWSTLDSAATSQGARRASVEKLCRRSAEKGVLSDEVRRRLASDPALGSKVEWTRLGAGTASSQELLRLLEVFVRKARIEDESIRFDWSGLETGLAALPHDADFVDEVRAFWRAGHRGRLEAAATELSGVPDEGVWKKLRKAIESSREVVAGWSEHLDRLIDEEQCDKAKRLLLLRLKEWPENEEFNSRLKRVESIEDGWGERLAEIRAMQREGRISEALRSARALGASGDLEAPVLAVIEELESRRDVVTAGVAEVERRLRVPSARAREELERAMGRLRELEAVQSDSSDLQRLREAVEAEQSGCKHLESMRRAIDSDSVDGLDSGLTDYRNVRDRLMDSGRLRGQEQSLAESARNRARQSLDRGEVAACLRWLGAADSIPVEAGRSSAAALERTARGRRAAADRLIEQARDAWRDGQHDRARSLLDAARDQASDIDSVRRFESFLREGGAEAELLERAEAERERGDLDAANRTLRSMGATPKALRSRVFDFKRSLAEAQGFGDAFLLRVDDAGEILVFRGESVTIGNLREGVADLPMLARLKGVHARLRRSMSFHGGLSDRIQTEAGELFDSEGVPVERIDLGGPVGFRLGDSVRFDYQRPSERSLSANLQVGGGFRVGSCDRLVWMKDRGRDGRVLIGSARDAHVRVPAAKAEVELYAERDGRLFVHCDEGLTIDGREVRGRHPVPPSGVVRADGIEFVVLPWSRA